MKNFILSLIITIALTAAIFLMTRYNEDTEVIVKGDLPAIELLLNDSVTKYNVATITGNRPVILLFFNTTCDHCQTFAASLRKEQEHLTDIDIIMASTEELSQITRFQNQYFLIELQNLIIGKDFASAGISTFQFESYPFCALYNEKHKFIKSFERNFTLENLLAELKP